MKLVKGMMIGITFGTVMGMAIGAMNSDNLCNVVKTGKSCAIRINVPVITFSKSFEEQETLVHQAFQAVDRLYNLSIKLEMTGIYNLFN